VICGVCEQAAIGINEYFIKYMRTKRPFVVLKMAATLDGRIATRTGDARWVTGPEARGFVHQLRHAVDAIMVGVGTVVADDPELTTRLDKGRGVDPARVVLDTRLSISSGARMLNQQSCAQTIIVCGPDAAKADKMRLEDKGASVMEVPLKHGRIDMSILMERLGRRGITSVLIEGGSLVAGAALKAGVVDKVHFFYALKILGGDDGIPMCAGQGPDKMAACMPLTGAHVNRMGDDIIVTGYLK
jgi:diaminohydroxyphosphoribosylaminopyrimidine deaminase/5-amino-6-(5-phosphoribosylamino)uracil reductase